MKTKHIVEFSGDFELKVNAFLERTDIEVIDIKYQAIPLEAEHYNPTAEFSALILYKSVK